MLAGARAGTSLGLWQMSEWRCVTVAGGVMGGQQEEEVFVLGISVPSCCCFPCATHINSRELVAVGNARK